MEISNQFDVQIFNDWYNKNFKTKINIEREIEVILNEFIKKLFSNIQLGDKEETVWSFFQAFVNDIALKVQSDHSDFDFDILPDFGSNNITEFRNAYVKPTKSMINKMWRVNNNVKGIDYIGLNNIKDRIKDLIRFSIRTNSLKNSEVLAQYFSELVKLKPEGEYKQYWDSVLDSIWVDSEMKTSTGYFAYHIYFKLKVGITIEMQIYSILSDSWKKLSHKIYEVVRDEINVKYNFNDVHSRIISIGHLLYLADCELYNLEQELKRE